MVRLKKWCEPQVSIGETGYSGVQAESNGGGHVQRAEENQGELQGVQDDNISILLCHLREKADGIVMQYTQGVDIGER